jgi:hypothetical protein
MARAAVLVAILLSIVASALNGIALALLNSRASSKEYSTTKQYQTLRDADETYAIRNVPIEDEQSRIPTRRRKKGPGEIVDNWAATVTAGKRVSGKRGSERRATRKNAMGKKATRTRATGTRIAGNKADGESNTGKKAYGTGSGKTGGAVSGAHRAIRTNTRLANVLTGSDGKEYCPCSLQPVQTPGTCYYFISTRRGSCGSRKCEPRFVCNSVGRSVCLIKVVTSKVESIGNGRCRTAETSGETLVLYAGGY